MTVGTAVRAFAIGAAFLAGWPAPATAQTAGQPPQPDRQAPPPSQTGSRWEIEVHGGLSMISAASGGTAALPLPGAPIVTSSPIFPSWKTSSWFFGDGASLLNEANGQLGAGTITPLDTVLRSLGLSSAPGASLGMRARFIMSPRLSVEVSFDRLMRSRSFTDAMKGGLEASRSTFESAMTGLFGSGPFTATTVKATNQLTNGQNGEVAVAGGIVLRLRNTEVFVPYLTVGGGIVRPTGHLPTAQLQGHYQTMLAGSVPIDETDTVTIRYSTSPRLVGVLGGGVRRDVSDRWGYRVDGRVFLSSGTDALLLDASPSSKTGTPAGFVETLTYPNLQFSNNASTGRSSTLSGLPIEAFKAFTGGLEARVLITVGIFVRF